MGSDRSATATSIAMAHAPSIGGSWLVVPVISAARMSPVTGACTDAVKNAANPITAQAGGLGTACEGVREERRIRPARGDAIAAHPRLDIIERDRAGEAMDGALAGDVGSVGFATGGAQL